MSEIELGNLQSPSKSSTLESQQWQAQTVKLQRSLELAQVLRQVTDQIRSTLDFTAVIA